MEIYKARFKMRKIAITLLPLVSVACLFGSSKLINPEAQMATVDGRVITFASLDSTVMELKRSSESGMSGDGLKTDALDSLIARELIEIRIDSTMNEIEKELEFRLKKRDSIGETAKKILYQKQVAERIQIDSAMVVAHYESHDDDFVESEQVKARHILIRRLDPDTAGVESEEEKQRLIDEMDDYARDRAQYVLDKALAGENWDSLAAEYSEDQSNASKGGNLGYFYRGRMVPEFDSVAFSTPPGEIVAPISTRFGYHIIRVDDYKPDRQKPLDEDLENEIRNLLKREKEKEYATVFVDSLKQAVVYEYNEEALATDDSLPPDTWVMVANSRDTLFYNRYAEALPRYMKFKQIETATVEDKKDMLGFLATNLLLLDAARIAGYLESPEVAEASYNYSYREAKRRVTSLFKDTEYQPSEEEVEAYFNANIEDYRYERPLLVHHIIFEDSLLAVTVRDSILEGMDFVEMARRYYPGEPEIREVAYNLDYIGPEDMGSTFYRVADELSVGQISHPVKTNWGYHIIKLVSRKEDKTLKQVKPGIKHTLRKRRDAEVTARYLEEWKAIAEIIINEQLMDKFQPSDQPKVIEIEPGRTQAGS
jgi:parvulin-like peptidyl-prolyl isomerase